MINNSVEKPQTPKNESGRIYGSSLLCYQNVAPPSPTSSIVINDTANDDANNEKIIEAEMKKKSIENLDALTLGTTTAGTLASMAIGETATLPVVVKKRSKLRHRFSDVGSWGRKKKERTTKYRSMHVESIEMLGDPVIEDVFFVSRT